MVRLKMEEESFQVREEKASGSEAWLHLSRRVPSRPNRRPTSDTNTTITSSVPSETPEASLQACRREASVNYLLLDPAGRAEW